MECLFCGIQLQQKEGEPPSEVKRRKFCSLSCSAKYNNPHHTKVRTLQEKATTCGKCGKTFSRERDAKNRLTRHLQCSDCRNDVKLLTKGALFEKRSSWQSARSTIRKHAVDAFMDHGKPMVCAVCGYNKHVEIAHIKAVSDFDKDSSLTEINHIDNLVALCPNHHWEYDAGLLQETLAKNSEGTKIPGEWITAGAFVLPA